MSEQLQPRRPLPRLANSGETIGNSSSNIPRLDPIALKYESSKSTPSNDRSTETSSIPPPINTPRTPYTPVSQSPAQATFRIPASPRDSTISMPDHEVAAKSAKVAIPRLKRAAESGDGNIKSGSRHRVNHACEPCRHRKTKCSGERPTCRHCQDFKIHCYYADGKRDRVKKQYSSMQDKVIDYEKILRGLSNRVSDADAELIRVTLERASLVDPDEAVLDTATSGALPSVELDGEADISGAESEVSGGRGSTGALDRTDEDFTREGANTTGFMGKNSDVTWLRRLKQENEHDERTAQKDSTVADTADPPGPSFRPSEMPPTADAPYLDQGSFAQDSSYHLNDIAISTYEAVDAYEMPTPDHAQQLFDTYMARVHPSFPIVGRVNLQNQFAKFLSRPVTRPPAKWLAILNMIFAISAKYSHLVQADWQADDRDHLIYFTRARLLVFDTDTLFNHPDLQMIQVFGLVGYYLMALNQMNRAWSIVGLAVRHANALALNMRNDTSQLTNGLKEIRYRVWWALYTLEHQLCSVTGRPNCIVDLHCTTPLPVPLNEEEFDSEIGSKLLSKEHQRAERAPSSNTHTPPAQDSKHSSRSVSNKTDNSRSPSAATSVTQGELEWTKDVQPSNALFFLHLVQLQRVTETIFQELYNPHAVEGTWSDIQATIGTLNRQLENWYRALPATFDFKRRQRDRDFYEARLSLGFHYYATKQMLHRPCLCRLDIKIPGQSQKSHEFNQAAATTCVISALDQLALIPDEPNAVGLLRVGPWADILHMLVQSTTVISLELSFRANHMPQQVDELLESAKKAVRWLHALGDENLAAARAWRICTELLHGAATKVGRQVNGIPDKPPRAAGTYSDDTTMSGMTAMQGRSFDTSPGHQAQYISGPIDYDQMNIPTTNGFIPNLPLDHFGRYDQMLSMSGNLNHAHNPYQQSSGQMPYDAIPSDADIRFMNQYTEQQDDSASRAGQHGSSSYN